MFQGNMFLALKTVRAIEGIGVGDTRKHRRDTLQKVKIR